MRRFLVALSAGTIATQATAGVVSVEIKEQRPWIPGREFKAGQYELLSGIIHYEIDPLAKSSRDIADIRLAPRNARGKVDFHGPFMVLRPFNSARSNGATIFEVANRGSTQMQGVLIEFDTFSLIGNKIREVSRPALFDMGYTFAWAGWQGDLEADEFGLAVRQRSERAGPRHQLSGLSLERPGWRTFAGNPLLRGQPGRCHCRAASAPELRRPRTVVPRNEWSFA